jgi:hypothetical protein
VKLTALDQGYFIVSVNKTDVSQHTSEREAIERATNLELTDPSDVVEYRHDYRVKVESALPLLPPVVVPPSAKVLFRWDATTLAPFFLHAKDPGRVTLVTVGGRSGVRLQTLPGDNDVNGSGANERCDLRLGNDLSFANEGRVVLFKHSVWFPSDFPDLPQSNGSWNWASFFNWHDDSDTPGSQGPVQAIFFPPTAISPDRPTGLVYQMFGGTTGVAMRFESRLGPIVRNTWYDFESRIKWTSADDGFYETRLNGVLAFSYQGPTLHAGHGAYLKLANYHTAFGQAVAIVQGVVSIEEALV